MRKFILAGLSVLLVVCAFYLIRFVSVAHAKTMPLPATKPTANVVNGALKIGKTEFYSQKLGTDGLSCAKCHVYSVGKYIPKMHMKIKSLNGVAAKFPMRNPKTKQVVTLAEKVNMCIRGALKGKPLQGAKLNDLVLYIKSLNQSPKNAGKK